MRQFLFAIIGMAVCLSGAQAQSLASILDGRAVKIQVRHADPCLIVALIQGMQVQSPELSTILNFAGIPTTIPDDAFVPKGRMIVDPTDNSIWYLPGAQAR